MSRKNPTSDLTKSPCSDFTINFTPLHHHSTDPSDHRFVFRRTLVADVSTGGVLRPLPREVTGVAAADEPAAARATRADAAPVALFRPRDV